MHDLVKIIINEDGDKVDDPKWHWIENNGDSERTLCGGEVFGFGEGNAEYKIKTVNRGGITCSQCLQLIKEFKAIKL
jgi:hypothetical protein